MKSLHVFKRGANEAEAVIKHLPLVARKRGKQQRLSPIKVAM